MMRKAPTWSALAVAGALAVMQPPTVCALIGAEPTSAEHVQAAHLIALVKIVSHRIEGDLDADGCGGGHRYTANVVEVLKGPSLSKLEFFSGVLLDTGTSVEYLIVATDRRYIKGAPPNCVDGYSTAHETPPNPKTETLSLVESRTLTENEERWVNISDPLGFWFMPEDPMAVKRDRKDGRAFVPWGFTRSLIKRWLSEP